VRSKIQKNHFSKMTKRCCKEFTHCVCFSLALKQYTESEVSDEEFAKRHELFPFNTPATKEAFFYRKIFQYRISSFFRSDRSVDSLVIKIN
jgi:hypothetical protein